MKDVIVVMHATHRMYLMDEYEGQLRDAEIDFHVEPVELPDGIGSMTMRWRLDYWLRMCEKFSDYDRIVFTDAWDVLFYGSKEELLTKIPYGPTISGERNCWPEPEQAMHFASDSQWCFCNPGMACGFRQSIVEWIGYFMFSPELELMDQTWCNRHNHALEVDKYTKLFYVASVDREDGSLKIKDGKPWNSRWHTFPQFIHFAGPCHPQNFRDLLAGKRESL